MQTIGLSNVQKELLKLYANNVSEETLLEIKQILAKYFAEKATSAMDEFWDENGLTEQTMIDWTNEHNRAETRN
ncbi:MAG TPA: hypothetical protein PKE69_15285 [Pyrinomonadaceae bacterium]|nr:hypothetical protein [Pyrinomonadaceae bacterium]